MSKAIKHTVEGAHGVRKSPRVYTHAIIAKLDYKALLADYTKRYEESARDGFQWATNESKLVIGTLKYPNERPGSLLADVRVDQDDITEANRRLAEYGGTIENAVAGAREMAREQVEAIKKNNGGEGAFTVMAWSQSEANAHKAAKKYVGNTWYRTVDVRVVETVRHAK